MNRVHIILWGQESGLISKDKCASEQTICQLESFASLVAAHESEQCARLVDLESKLMGKKLQSADAIRARST